MFKEETEMTLECAVKVRKHLMRVLELRNESGLQDKLNYVNDLIMEANSMQDEALVFA